MKFNGSVAGKIVGAILCVLLGMIIALGGEVGAVYYILTASTVGQVADKLEPSLPEGTKLEFDEETRSMTVLNWGKELIGLAGSGSTTTIGQLEGLIGLSVISNTLYEMMGVDASTVKASTLSGLGQTITDSLTLSSLSEKFGIELPDMPLFENSEFMDQKISEAFKDLTKYPLSDFVKIDEENGNKIMIAIKDLTIDDLGGEKLTEKINSLKLSDIIEIKDGTGGGEKSNAVLIALKDLTVGELSGDKGNEAINSLFISEIMTVNESSEKIMQALKYASLESKILTIAATEIGAEGAYLPSADYFTAHPDEPNRELPEYDYVYKAEDGTAYAYVMKDGQRDYDEVNGTYKVYATKLIGEGESKVYRPIIGINDTVATLTIGEIVDIKPDDKLMNSLSGSTLKSIASDINRLFLDEIMTINEGSSKTIQALKYASLKTATKSITPATGFEIAADQKLEGYVYLYDADHKAYVAKIADNGGYLMDDEQYVCVETRLYDGKYRPLSSIDDVVNTLTIGELMEVTESSTSTLKTLKNAALKSAKSHIAGASLTDGTSETAAQEEDGYVYKYSALGLAYVCVTDKDGDPVVTDGVYELYNTRYLDGKFKPLMGIDDRIDRMTLGEVIVINEQSSRLMKNLKDTRVNDLGSAIDKMFLDEMMTITSESEPVLLAIRYSVLDGSKVYINQTATDTDTAAVVADPDYLTAYKAYEVDGYVYKYKQNDKGVYVPYVCYETSGVPVVENRDGTDYYKVYETKLYEGKNRPLVSINEKLGELTLGDVFKPADLQKGVLSMVPASTKLNKLSDEVAASIKNSTMAELNGLGVLEVEKNGNMDSTRKEVRAFIWDNTVSNMLDGMLLFVGNPALHADKVIPTEVTLAASYSSLTDFVAAYAQFSTLVLSSDVTVTVDPTQDAAFLQTTNAGSVYVVPAFNLDSKALAPTNGFALTFSGETVQLAVYEYESGALVLEDGTYKLDRQFYYSYDYSGNYNLTDTVYEGSGLKYYNGTAGGAETSQPTDKNWLEYKHVSD